MGKEKTVYEGDYTAIKITYFLPDEKIKDRSAGKLEGRRHVADKAYVFAEIRLLDAEGKKIIKQTVFWNEHSVSGKEYKEKLHEIYRRRDREILKQKEAEEFSKITEELTQRTRKYLDPNQDPNQLDFDDIKLSQLSSATKKMTG